MKHAIIPSNTAITVENAANDIKRKNTDYVAVMEGGRLGEFSESIECTV